MVIGPRPLPVFRVAKIIEDYKRMARLPRVYCPDLTNTPKIISDSDDWNTWWDIPETVAPPPVIPDEEDTPLIGNVINIYI